MDQMSVWIAKKKFISLKNQFLGNGCTQRKLIFYSLPILQAHIQTYFKDKANITINSKLFATIGYNSNMRLLEIYRKAPDMDLIVKEESNSVILNILNLILL